jgi:hypothetical protein
LLLPNLVLRDLLLLAQQSLILTLLVANTLQCLLILIFARLRLIIQVGESLFSLSHILRQNRVDVRILLLLLHLQVFFPLLLEDLLKLLLLFWIELVCVLKQLQQLLITQAHLLQLLLLVS